MAKRYGLVIDLERCIGCHTCRIACKVENNINTGSGIRVETVGGPHRDTPLGKFPCMHCAKPPCVDACPLEAIYKREDGIVLVDEEKCNGCQACIPACPYDALIYNPERDIVQKCSLCAQRIDQGLEPFCVLCCETEAMFFGDLDDPASEVSQIILRKGAYILHPEKGTNPAIYYCPVCKPGIVQEVKANDTPGRKFLR
jgi:molybdopterin-containing oxidoreductase family iron-sulfur binding subunit